MNLKKTKLMIFNVRGIKIMKNTFYVGNFPIEIVDNYQYLGIKFKPSGSFQVAMGELFDKASRAWFSISNVLYQHKKLAIKKALQLFDSLIRPICLYAVEFWLPFVLSKKGLTSFHGLMKCWESFQPELINQKLCRMLLSVHKKSSRLAVLGELGRYPLLLPAVKLCLKYQYSLENVDKNSLIYKTLLEMKNSPQLDSWLSRVQKIKTFLKIGECSGKPKKVGAFFERKINSVFDRFFLDEITKVNMGQDGLDHNKLRLYKTFKGSFKQEPYLCIVNNRNQRAWLSRYRISAHNLRIESGRHTSPVTPVAQRVCVYCASGECDTELHAILKCETFRIKRQCFLSRMTALCPSFSTLTDDQKLSSLLCPVTAKIAKCVNKYLGIISKTRSEIDLGLNIADLELYIQHKA